MVKKKKNPAAVALARRRALSLSPERRREIAKLANSQRKANLKISLAQEKKEE